VCSYRIGENVKGVTGQFRPSGAGCRRARNIGYGNGSGVFILAAWKLIYSKTNWVWSQREKFAAEKAELEVILGAGILDRSPSLAQILTYVCGK